MKWTNHVLSFSYLWKQILSFNFHLVYFGRNRGRRDAEISNSGITNATTINIKYIKQYIRINQQINHPINVIVHYNETNNNKLLWRPSSGQHWKHAICGSDIHWVLFSQVLPIVNVNIYPLDDVGWFQECNIIDALFFTCHPYLVRISQCGIPVNTFSDERVVFPR